MRRAAAGDKYQLYKALFDELTQTAARTKSEQTTFIKAAAALRLMTATDSRLRRRGNQLRAERELEREQREAVPGVMGVCGTLKPSTSSTRRKARPRARGSTICAHAHGHTHTHSVLVHSSFFILICHATNNNKQRATHK